MGLNERLLFFPLFTLLGLLSPNIIIIFFGAQWSPAIPIMQILVIVGMVSVLLYIHDSVLIANGKPHWKFMIDTINASINVIIILYTAKTSLTAVAYGYTSRAFLLAPISIVCVCKLLQLPISKYFKSIFPYIIATAFMTLVIYLFQKILTNVNAPIIYSLTLVPIGVTVYCVTLRVAFPKTLQIISITPKVLFNRTNET